MPAAAFKIRSMPDDYIGRSEWFEEMHKNGYEQSKCKVCKLFTVWRKGNDEYRTCQCEEAA